MEPRFEFDPASSSHSTLLQVVAPDTPGLLRALAAAIAAGGANIEVALVDTEGEVAIDVFYLTVAGNKLSGEDEDRIAGRLRAMFPGSSAASAGATAGATAEGASALA